MYNIFLDRNILYSWGRD